ncbi:VOC family protein [Streptomyces iconiensis]|uniref:VOC family protein n=1 Tax=Streptomyces iconiensis TaxID=1384038 RepID=A0ABT7A3Y8_9ACTN|nr:VOC family protein [Streptomyces iconiensis]MDJ1136058.1 VOC family protein [Streptomyces iconiensis]
MTPTPVHWKLVVDAHDPHAQADFWSAALHYEVEDHSGLIGRLLGLGAISSDLLVEHHDRPAWRDAAAVRHPEDPFTPESGAGLGRRLLFNRVPESEEKPAKNRLHIDLHGPAGERETEVKRLSGLGATVQDHVKEQGGEWVIMTDPEGNEFCVH